MQSAGAARRSPGPRRYELHLLSVSGFQLRPVHETGLPCSLRERMPSSGGKGDRLSGMWSDHYSAVWPLVLVPGGLRVPRMQLSANERKLPALQFIDQRQRVIRRSRSSLSHTLPSLQS